MECLQDVEKRLLPVRTSGVAEWGMVAASWGMELMSGSGVLLGGEIARGVIANRDFSCTHTHTHTYNTISKNISLSNHFYLKMHFTSC